MQIDPEITSICNLRVPIWGTFKFPKIMNANGILTPFNKHDTDEAEDLIRDWYLRTNKIVPFKFFAFPEVLEKERRTRTPLHYHALFDPTNPQKFMRIAQQKWSNLLRHRLPNAMHRHEPLWLEWIDRARIESPEAYCLKHCDDEWNWNHRLTDESIMTRYTSIAA
jgi:hypothetical protein